MSHSASQMRLSPREPEAQTPWSPPPAYDRHQPIILEHGAQLLIRKNGQQLKCPAPFSKLRWISPHPCYDVEFAALLFDVALYAVVLYKHV